MANDLFTWLEETGGMKIPINRIIKKAYGDYKHPNQY